MPDDLLESLSFALGEQPARQPQEHVADEVKEPVQSAAAVGAETTVAAGSVADAAGEPVSAAEAGPEAGGLTQSAADVQRRERRAKSDRRSGGERRGEVVGDYSGPERRRESDRRRHAERRLGGVAGRRAQDHKEFQDRIDKGELTLEEVEFVRAIDRYKRKYERPFPTWSEILAIVKELGYTKDAF